jgi:hypothetical protein
VEPRSSAPDAAPLDFVDLLADRAGTLPLLIVCTARPELGNAVVGGGKTNAMTISLFARPTTRHA